MAQHQCSACQPKLVICSSVFPSECPRRAISVGAWQSSHQTEGARERRWAGRGISLSVRCAGLCPGRVFPGKDGPGSSLRMECGGSGVRREALLSAELCLGRGCGYYATMPELLSPLSTMKTARKGFWGPGHKWQAGRLWAGSGSEICFVWPV